MQDKHWTGISRHTYRRVMSVNRVQVRNFVDGHFVDGPCTFDKVSPVDGAVVADVHLADSVLVDRAVQAARRALNGTWGASSVPERVALLRRVADGIEERFDDF